MVRFELTLELKQKITSSALDQATKQRLLLKNYIHHDDLKTFYLKFKPTSSYIDLLRLTKLYIKKTVPAPIPKTEEFLNSMKMLKLKQNEDEYQRLINPSQDFQTLYEPAPSLSISKQTKELKSHITTIFNIIISVASVVYAIWYWTNSSWGLKDSYRVLLCLFFGILTLTAEVVVYLGYLNKIEQARIKERSKKEVKTVIRSFEIK